MTSLVFPFHDPNNIETKFLRQILPILKSNFQNAFVSITPKTAIQNLEAINFLKQDNFFIVNFNKESTTSGDHFVAAYTNAVKNSRPEQILHLCTSDRLSFALLTDYKNSFLKDTTFLKNTDCPRLFLRSKKAWSTHPKNYFATESLATKTGQILFGKSLDYTWCHLAITAKQLSEVLPNLTAHDLVICSQLLMNLKKIKTKRVDWLSWEDPFIFVKDPKQFKLERENDSKELEKRMGYVLPEINYLFEIFKAKPH